MSRDSFSKAFARALDDSGLNRGELADAAGVSGGLISNWYTGKVASPTPDAVFAIEKALRLPPGHLSGHLGFQPAGAAEQPDLVATIYAAPNLTAGQRDLMVRLYREFAQAEPLHESLSRATAAESFETDRPRREQTAAAAGPAPAPRGRRRRPEAS